MMDSNPGKFDWSDKILNKFKIDKEKLPQIKKSTEIAGKLTIEASKELNLNNGIPVFVSSGDLTSAALGSGGILDNKPIRSLSLHGVHKFFSRKLSMYFKTRNWC
jgi:xylulokinase